MSLVPVSASWVRPFLESTGGSIPSLPLPGLKYQPYIGLASGLCGSRRVFWGPLPFTSSPTPMHSAPSSSEVITLPEGCSGEGQLCTGHLRGVPSWMPSADEGGGHSQPGFPAAQLVKNPPAVQIPVPSLSQEDPLEKGQATLPAFLGFPGGSAGKESAHSAGDLGVIPGLGRPPGGERGNPLQFPCLENPRDRGAWRAAVHGVAKSQGLDKLS